MRTAALLIGLSLVEVCPSGQSQSCNVPGFINSVYKPGYNLIANPLQTTNHLLSFLFLDVPDRTTISLWNPTSQLFEPTSTYTAGLGWSQDFAFDPGRGALLYTPIAFTNSFIGGVMEPDGSPLCPDGPFIFPSPCAGPMGVYLLSSKLAATLGGPTLDVFQFILGRAVQEGEQFTWLDDANQTYHTTLFWRGAWSNGEPVLPIGASAFFYTYAYTCASPSLQIFPLSNNVVLSWPISAPNFILETSTNLSTAAIWAPLTNGIATNVDNFVLTNTVSRAGAFYRLHMQ